MPTGLNELLRQIEGDPLDEQRRRCVRAVARRLQSEGWDASSATSRAFAICTASLQRQGYLEKGTAKPTPKGMAASLRKLADPDAESRHRGYERLLGGARRSRGSRALDLDALLAEVEAKPKARGRAKGLRQVPSTGVYAVLLGHEEDMRHLPRYLRPATQMSGIAGVEIKTLRQAQERLESFIELTGSGSSSLHRYAGVVVDPQNRPIALVSYNGRVWELPSGVRSLQDLMKPRPLVAGQRQSDYRPLLIAASKPEVPAAQLDRPIKAWAARAAPALDLEALLAQVEGGPLPLPGGSRNATSNLSKELQPLRDAMEEVFACDTAYGDCHPQAPSAGHCMLASMVVQDLFGGQIVGGKVKNIPHYWNRIDTRDVDVTGDQFGFGEVRVKRGALHKGTPFRRAPQEKLAQPYNREVTKLHKRFVKRLIPVLKHRGHADWAAQLGRV